MGTGGAGFGLQIGAEVTECMIILNTDAAVKAFSQSGNVALGAGLSVAAGPIGRSVEAGVLPVAAVYTYSQSQGLFAGIALEGTIIATRGDANAAYYGRAAAIPGKRPNPLTTPTSQLAFRKHPCDNTPLSGTI